MKRLSSLFVCSCCSGVTRDPRGDVCHSCYQWATDSLVTVIANRIQAELTPNEVSSALNTLNNVNDEKLARILHS